MSFFLREEQAVSPLVLILVVILVLSLLGGGYGFRSGNTILGGPISPRPSQAELVGDMPTMCETPTSGGEI